MTFADKFNNKAQELRGRVKRNAGQVKQDVQTGRDRAESQGQRVGAHLSSTDSDGYIPQDGSTQEWSTGRPERY